MKIGLSLGGGGTRGYAHLGVIRALEEANIPIDMINGTSIGAVMGGGYALYNDIDIFINLVKQVIHKSNINYYNIFHSQSDSQSFLRTWMLEAVCDIASLRSSIQSNRNQHKALRAVFGEYTFADTKIPFSAVAHDLISGKPVIFKKGKLVDGILPSVTLPGIFPPVRRRNRLLVDGYVLSNTPVQELRMQGADFIIAVELISTDKHPYENGLDLLNGIEDMKQRQLDDWQIAEADFHIKVNFELYTPKRFENYENAMKLGYDTTKITLTKLLKMLEKNG
jgi:NTE family protein